MRDFLCVGVPVKDSSLYYLTRFSSFDQILYLKKGGKEIMLVPAFEVDRAKKESRIGDVRRIYNLSEFLKDEGIRKILVPPNFPFEVGEKLRKEGMDIKVSRWVERRREIKNQEEIKLIQSAQRVCEMAMEVAGRMLKKRCTSEDVRERIQHLILTQGCESGPVIVASGKESADPHFLGSGIISEEPVVVDISARYEGYFADFTRTWVGRELRGIIGEMHEAVVEAQDAAIRRIRDGVLARDVHGEVLEVFDRYGFRKKFPHSTGHGIGLDLHEPPRIGSLRVKLKKGNVVTVEPALYDPEVGGVRIEDIVVVKTKGSEKITRFKKKLCLNFTGKLEGY